METQITQESLTNKIQHVEQVKFITKGGQILRWAVLTMQNGFAVTGDPSAAVDPENDNEEMGQKIALENAIHKAWILEGYSLKEKLHDKKVNQVAKPSTDPIINPISDPSLQQYIGVKMILAKPMTRQAYNDYRGWELPEDEKHLANESGYLVEYNDPEHSNHPNHKGYISWSPDNVFNEAYRLTNGMSFGLAIEAVKKGMKVARSGWNGKNIFIALQEPDENSFMTYPYIYIDSTQLDTDNPDAVMNRVPWLASQTDMLAEDWMVIQ